MGSIPITGGLILIIGGLGVLGGLQLKSLLFTSVYIVISYQLMAIFVQDMLETTSMAAIFIINNLFLLTAVAISAFTAQFLESYSRKVYLQSLELRRLVKDLRFSRDKLESTLKEQVEWSKLFTSYIRHEMGNSMIGVSTSLQMIKRKKSNEGVMECTTRAEHSLNDLRELLKKASDATSIDDVFAVADHQDVEICQLLETLCDQYCEFDNGVIEHELKKPLWIKGNPMLLNQLFRNLIDNAIRHSHPQKTVWIKVQGNNSVLVENEGDALSVNRIDQLFEVGDTSESKNPGLYGLGLYIA